MLRRKRDGAYLAADLPEGLLPLVPNLRRERGLDDALDALESTSPHARHGVEHVGELPLHRLHERLDALGIYEADYAARTGLDLVAEPDWLAFAGFDRYRRPLWLRIDAARRWLAAGAPMGDPWPGCRTWTPEETAAAERRKREADAAAKTEGAFYFHDLDIEAALAEVHARVSQGAADLDEVRARMGGGK